MNIVLRLRGVIRQSLEGSRGCVRIAGLRRVDVGLWLQRSLTLCMRWHRHLLELVSGRDKSLVCRRISGAIVAIWPNAVKFKSDTGRTRPSICGGRITFDLSASAAFASSHHCEENGQSSRCDYGNAIPQDMSEDYL